VSDDPTPPVGRLHLGDFRRTEPISRWWGYDRGTPVDRHYIESFLKRHADDIRGRVLEVKSADYAESLGGSRVSRAEVLDVDPENPDATLIADLVRPEQFPESAFDCFVCTQTLQYVFDLPAALRSVHRLLRPGGVLLLTVPGISRIDRDQTRRTGEFWRFTVDSVRRLCEGVFPEDAVEVESCGNVLAAAALLHGVALEELEEEEVDARDPDYPVIVTARCRKAEAAR
jgi:SAM-dependent methyltransferase